MSERIRDELWQLALGVESGDGVHVRFLEKAGVGGFSKDEDGERHVCAYFAGVDYKRGLVFMGHHKKSGLWLFNGGHTDRGELPDEAAAREMHEEWGVRLPEDFELVPGLLTVTEIENRPVQTCTEHLDVWCFVPIDSEHFRPKQEKLDVEFYETGWFTLSEAMVLAEDPATMEALNFLRKMGLSGSE